MPITQDRMISLIEIAKKLLSEIHDKQVKVELICAAWEQGELSAEAALESIRYEIKVSAIGPEIGMILGREDAHFTRMARINDKTRTRVQTYRIKQELSRRPFPAGTLPHPAGSLFHPAGTLPQEPPSTGPLPQGASTWPTPYQPPIPTTVQFGQGDELAQGAVPGEADLADL